jgi:hypothetical protein
LGSTNKIPQQYIPVAQGFYVTSSDMGGNAIFNNGQRIFVKESIDDSVFMRSSKETSNTTNSNAGQIQRVRLNVKSPDNAIRPLLLAFTPNDIGTDGIDFGYDAENTEDFPNDVSFMIEDRKFVIQGVGHFEVTKQYPLGLFLSDSGTFEIELTALENFDTNIDVYIYDAITETSYQINTNNYALYLNAGDFTDRFFITFQPSNTLSNFTNTDFANVIVNYLESTHEIYIRIPQDLKIQNLHLINILGQNVQSWNQDDLHAVNNEIRIPIKNISEGTYILKVESTLNRSLNKKILIRY